MLTLLPMLTLLVAAQASPVPAKSSADSPATVQARKHDTKKMDKTGKSAAQSDLDVIGYLGDYGDAADGLDPIGLAEDAGAMPRTPDSNKPQAGHP
ncbi:MAG: hypothetical protein JSS33_00525 [Proteobacteria bacterium]|nr:hypothetical protein [Pseudomonadota bacterium]